MRGNKGGCAVKISHKMILLFSAMILALVSYNVVYLQQTNIDGSDAFSAGRYRNMGDNMVRNMEQYVTMMDLAIEDLTTDTAFMEAFYQVATGSEADASAMLTNQNQMFQTMYHSAIGDVFYRVCVYTDDGFYLSNHIERNDSIVSRSDESRERIAGISYLRAVKAAPYRRHLIAPHRDAFTVSREVTVFSAVRAATWHGQHIGYIEVCALTDELDTLLLTDNQNVMIRAMLSDGSIFFASPQDEAVYDDIPLEEFMAYTDPVGLERNVYHVQSRWLGMDIYLAEDAAVRNAMIAAMTGGYMRRSIIVALIALVVVVFISLGLTRSMRRLNRKVRALPAEHLMLSSDAGLTTFVTTWRDKEIHELEHSFNDLLTRLSEATRSEMTMREGALRVHLKALQAQINPHFVYNTLNIISARGMRGGDEEIVNMCEQFAQMLRYSTNTQSETATLGEDLEHVRNYLRLLKARYEQYLEYEINVPEEMNAIVIPKLTLQPLVENAILHGVSEAEVCRVEINGTVADDRLCLEIRDNGGGFAPEVLSRMQQAIDRIEREGSAAPDPGAHIGLMNTCLRLHYYSQGAMHLALENDHGAVVRLTLELGAKK